MKVNHHPETDSLYIDLSEATSVESREVSEGVVLDYDEAGNRVGIDIDNASRKVQLQRFTVSKLPVAVETLAGSPRHAAVGAGVIEHAAADAATLYRQHPADDCVDRMALYAPSST